MSNRIRIRYGCRLLSYKDVLSLATGLVILRSMRVISSQQANGSFAESYASRPSFFKGGLIYRWQFPVSCFPNRKKFSELCESYDAVPVFRRLLSDSLTPVSAFWRLDAGTDACLFESVVGGERVGRYSFLATDPHMRLVASGNSISIIRGDQVETRVVENPMEEFRKLIESVRVAQLDDLPPFTGGAVGYAGYDVVRYVEDLPDSPPDDRGLSDMAFGFYDSMVVFDHITKTLTIVALARPDQFNSVELAYDTAVARIEKTIRQLSQPETELTLDDIEIETGDMLGERTDELEGDYINEWVASAPTSYAFKIFKGKSVCKVKGFSLNYINSRQINITSMKQLIEGEV